MKETPLSKRIFLRLCSLLTVRLFRNNVGTGWVGERVKARGTVMTPIGPMLITNRDVVLKNARPLHAGLTKGSGDYIGWETIVITPEMVGKKVAVFLSVEVKRPKGRRSTEQKNWEKVVQSSGGKAGFAECEEQAMNILKQQFQE